MLSLTNFILILSLSAVVLVCLGLFFIHKTNRLE